MFCFKLVNFAFKVHSLGTEVPRRIERFTRAGPLDVAQCRPLEVLADCGLFPSPRTGWRVWLKSTSISPSWLLIVKLTKVSGGRVSSVTSTNFGRGPGPDIAANATWAREKVYV